MKKLVVLFSVVMFVCTQQVQAQGIFSNVLGKVTDRVRSKIDEKVNDAIDSAVDKADKAASGSSKKKAKKKAKDEAKADDGTESEWEQTKDDDQEVRNESSVIEIVSTPSHFCFSMNGEAELQGLIPSSTMNSPKFIRLLDEMSQAFLYQSPEEIDKKLKKLEETYREIDKMPGLNEAQKKELRESAKLFALLPEDIEAAKNAKRPDFEGMLEAFRNYTINKTLYKSAEKVNDTLFIVQDVNSKKYGVINAESKQILPFKFTSIGFSDRVKNMFDVNIGKVDEGDLCGLYDWNGKELLPCIYNYVGLLPGMDVLGVFDKKTLLGGFFDKNTLKQVQPFVYTTYSYWTLVTKDNTGIPCCVVRDKNNKEGVVDKSGNLVVPCILRKGDVGNNYDDSIDVVANGKVAKLYFKTWKLEYE